MKKCFVFFLGCMIGVYAFSGAQGEEVFFKNSPLRNQISQDYEQVLQYGSVSLKKKYKKFLKNLEVLQDVRKDVSRAQKKRTFGKKNQRVFAYLGVWAACTLGWTLWSEYQLYRQSPEIPTLAEFRWFWASKEKKDDFMRKFIYEAREYNEELKKIYETYKLNGSPRVDPADLYKVFDLKEGDDFSKVKRSYYTKARECHPDKKPDDPEAEEKFKVLSEAYEKLETLNRGESLPGEGFSSYDEFAQKATEEFMTSQDPEIQQSRENIKNIWEISFYPINIVKTFGYMVIGGFISLPIWFTGSYIYKLFQRQKLTKEFNEDYFKKLEEDFYG